MGTGEFLLGENVVFSFLCCLVVIYMCYFCVEGVVFEVFEDEKGIWYIEMIDIYICDMHVCLYFVAWLSLDVLLHLIVTISIYTCSMFLYSTCSGFLKFRVTFSEVDNKFHR